MSQSKIKLYKNAARNNTTVAHKPYVPQYQILGVEPEEYKSPQLPANVTVARSNIDNPRTKKVTVRQPYPAFHQNINQNQSNIIPNVGNNMDQTWSSVDGDIIDNLEEEQFSQKFIDNNDYISENSFGTKTFVEQPRINEAVPSYNVQNQQDSEDLLAVIQDLSPQSYLLIVNGVSICSGPLDEIQDQARALVFGEHELCDGNPIPVEDLIILKKINIKMGLFLE